jgi:ankyrin repeat protein
LAAGNGHFKIVKYLVEKGADKESKDLSSHTPLHLAAKKGHFEIVKYLVENHVDKESKDYKDETPLHMASENGHFEIVKYLVEKGANIQASVYGKTPLDLANIEANKSYCTESKKENLAKIIQFLREILAQK